jgi:hypothetical protein
MNYNELQLITINYNELLLNNPPLTLSGRGIPKLHPAPYTTPDIRQKNLTGLVYWHILLLGYSVNI